MQLRILLNKSHLKSLLIRHQTKIKFLFVGGWNTLFSFLTFIGLYFLFQKIFAIDYFAYTSAQFIGFVLSVINAYVFHRLITFNSKTRGKEMIMEFIRFCSTYVVLFIIGLIAMPLFVEILKIRPIPASIILNTIVIATSYLGHSLFSFRKRS